MTRDETGSVAAVEDGMDIGQTQTGIPNNLSQPNRTDYRAMLFDKDGYALTHNRNIFAAAQWLVSLIDAEAQWPIVANDLRDYLDEAGHTADHIDEQISRLKPLIAPWLIGLRPIDKARAT